MTEAREIARRAVRNILATRRHLRAQPFASAISHLGSIHTCRSEVDQIIRYGGSTKETSIRRAVFSRINACARPRDLLLVAELDTATRGENAKSPRTAR